MSLDASQAVYEQAAYGPEHLHTGQVHDAFAIEELEYCELLGVCQAGGAEAFVRSRVEDVRMGLCHMIGGGSVGAIHMLKKES